MFNRLNKCINDKLNINGLKQFPYETTFSTYTKSLTKPSVNVEVLEQQYKVFTISQISSGT